MTNIKTPKAIDDNPQPLEDEKGNRTTLSVGQKSIVVDGEIYVNIPAGEHNTNQFVVVDGGQLKTRTGAEVLADIGDAGGDITQVSFTSLDDFSVQTVSSGNADFTTNGTNGITTSMSAGPVISITGVNASTSAHGVVQLIDEDNMSTDSATRVPTQQSVKAYVDTEVSGLVDSAPAALDTLNELAAALNDDASFSTTITNSLALKAPLAAPAFTGDATFASTITPSSNDAAALGTTSLQWSDLHLASGGKINWNNSDITLTHSASSGHIVVGGGNLSLGDNNITNVGNIALDTISSDAGTSIGVTLGTDAGDVDANASAILSDLHTKLNAVSGITSELLNGSLLFIFVLPSTLLSIRLPIYLRSKS